MPRSSRNLIEFHLFPKLPLDLQLKIWGGAEPEPRVIMQSKNSKEVKTRRCIPAILHACHQSRYEYLANSERKRSHATYTLVHMKLPTYFSFEIDTLYLLNDDPFDSAMIPKIRRLAVDIEVLNDPEFSHELQPGGKRDPEQVLKRISFFPRLEEVVFLQRPPKDGIAGSRFSWKMLDLKPYKVSPLASGLFPALVSRVERKWVEDGGPPKLWKRSMNQRGVILNMEWFWLSKGFGAVVPR